MRDSVCQRTSERTTSSATMWCATACSMQVRLTSMADSLWANPTSASATPGSLCPSNARARSSGSRSRAIANSCADREARVRVMCRRPNRDRKGCAQWVVIPSRAHSGELSSASDIFFFPRAREQTISFGHGGTRAKDHLARHQRRFSHIVSCLNHPMLGHSDAGGSVVKLEGIKAGD